MKKISFILFIFLILSCSTRKMYTDTYVVRMKNNSVKYIKYTYWDRFDMDSYKMEWLLKKEGINPDSVGRVNFGGRKVIKIKKKDL
jgi:hypothetical protein